MSRVFRHLTSGFQGVSRNFAMALSSISSVTVTLVIMAFFLLLSINIDNITANLEKSVQIHTLIEDEYSDTEEEVEALKLQIQDIPNVKDVVFSSKDEEFEVWIANIGAPNAEEIYGSYRGENNPMLAAFIVSATSGDHIKAVANEIATLEGIDKVAYGGDSTGDFLDTLDGIRKGGFVVVIALGLIAVFLISNTVRVSIHARRREISIMRTIGATNWYIRWPFIIEGMIIGLIGSIIPIILTIVGYRYLYLTNNGILISEMFALVDIYPTVFEVSMILALIGTVVGAIGSIFSVGKQLRWTR